MLFSCQDIGAFIDPIADGEIDEREHEEVNDHLARCSSCRQLVDTRLRLKRLVAESLQVPAPTGFKDRILASVYEMSSTSDSSNDVSATAQEAEIQAEEVNSSNRLATTEEIFTSPANSANSANGLLSPIHRNRKTVAAVLLAAAAVLLLAIIPQWTVAPATTEGLSVWEESVDWHRSDVPMEVQGPNQQNVISWFHGKVNFDVEPLSFGHQNQASLVGGRLASIHNRRAALLNYKVDGANVTVLVFDGKGISVPPERLQSFDNQKIAVMEGPGYDIALFHKNDLTYTITTDLPSSRFERLIQQVLSSN